MKTVPLTEVCIIKTIADLQLWCQATHKQGLTFALVPTMGALHDGHLELVRQGLQRADRVIASIFVNPTQFGPNEDFSAYPRTWEADLEKLRAVGAHAVYYPNAAEIYPSDFATTVAVKGVTDRFEGAIRPGHFDGVATVVTKLLLQVLPDLALFGEKDYQQLQLIKRMVADLDIPVEIIGVPIVRDAEGLALSSRNAYLSAEQLKIARRLNKILYATADKIRQGMAIAAAEAWAANELSQAGFDAVDYVSAAHADTLAPPLPGDPLRLLAVARLGKTRLLDNVPVTPVA